MKKSIMLIFILIVGAVFLFAGGKQEKETAKPEAETGAVEERIKTPIETYNPDFTFPTEKIEISYWHVLGTRPGYHQLAQEFAEEYSSIHPNVSITIREIPNAEQRAIWASAFQSHSAPDIAWIEAQVGLMYNGLLETPPWALKMMEEMFTPYAMSLSKVAGKYYGWAGCEIDVGQMLYYNKDMFREAGLDPENPPEYLPEWLEAAKKLTKRDASGRIQQAGVALRYAGGHQGIGDKFSKFGAAFVDTRKRFYYNEDYTDVIFDDPGWIEAAQFYKDLIFNYKVTSTTLPYPIEAVGTGLAAMTNRESFFAGWLEENAPDIDYGIGPLPSGKPPIGNYETGAMPWLAFQGVTVDSKHPEVAWDFNMFMALPENEIKMAKNNGGLSRHKKYVDDPFFKELPYYDVYVYMTKERPLVRNPYQDPNALQAELEAKLGEVALELLTNENSNPMKLMKDLAAYGRKRLKEIK
ncbi:MAG: hypothetical protein DRP87_10040 [Spirochaetes bacterium]|nr:MAG: hypothetical protein DRP87_10040 [Spirochaetota bacterium]